MLRYLSAKLRPGIEPRIARSAHLLIVAVLSFGFVNVLSLLADYWMIGFLALPNEPVEFPVAAELGQKSIFYFLVANVLATPWRTGATSIALIGVFLKFNLVILAIRLASRDWWHEAWSTGVGLAGLVCSIASLAGGYYLTLRVINNRGIESLAEHSIATQVGTLADMAAFWLAVLFLLGLLAMVVHSKRGHADVHHRSSPEH